MPNILKDIKTGDTTTVVDTSAADNDTASDSSSNSDAPDERLVRATKQGWRPKEQWDGDPDQWVDYTEFLDRGEHIASIASSRAQRAEKRVAELEQTVLALNENYQKLNAADRAQAKKQIQNLESQLAQLQAAKAGAISASDGEAAVRIERQIENVKQETETLKDTLEPPKPATTAPTGPAPEGIAWSQKNPWFGADVEASIYAEGMMRFYRERVNPQGNLAEALKYVDEKIATRFPEYATVENKRQNMTRNKPASPESGQSGMRAARQSAEDSNVRTYNELPEMAKKVCDNLCKTVKGYTREKYLKSYQWD